VVTSVSGQGAAAGGCGFAKLSLRFPAEETWQQKNTNQIWNKTF